MIIIVTIPFDRFSHDLQDSLLLKHIILCEPLQSRYNERDVVSIHRRLDCLLNRLFRCTLRIISKLRVSGLFEENSPVTGEFPHQGPGTRKMVPFVDVRGQDSNECEIEFMWNTTTASQMPRWIQFQATLYHATAKSGWYTFLFAVNVTVTAHTRSTLGPGYAARALTRYVHQCGQRRYLNIRQKGESDTNSNSWSMVMYFFIFCYFLYYLVKIIKHDVLLRLLNTTCFFVFLIKCRGEVRCNTYFWFFILSYVLCRLKVSDSN